MSKPGWITIVDLTDGGVRESWSTFYAGIYVADSEEEAHYIGDRAIAEAMDYEWEEECPDGMPDYYEYQVRKADQTKG